MRTPDGPIRAIKCARCNGRGFEIGVGSGGDWICCGCQGEGQLFRQIYWRDLIREIDACDRRNYFEIN